MSDHINTEYLRALPDARLEMALHLLKSGAHTTRDHDLIEAIRAEMGRRVAVDYLTQKGSK